MRRAVTGTGGAGRRIGPGGACGAGGGRGFERGQAVIDIRHELFEARVHALDEVSQFIELAFDAAHLVLLDLIESRFNDRQPLAENIVGGG